MTIQFPPHDSPVLGLAHPTKAEFIAQTKLNGVEWKGALSADAYLRREEHLASQALTKNSGITYWILVDLSLPPDQRPVLAGCETYRKRALAAESGHVKDVIAHGIGSVFTPPSFRGRGYAARMLRELAVKLEHYQAAEQPCLFSILFSDIGKNFYTRLGWKPFQSTHVSLAPKASTVQGSGSVSLLQADDVFALCARDEEMSRQSLARVTAAHEGPAVSLCPDYQTMAWHHAREEFVSGEVLHRVPTVKGALCNIDGSRQAWCIWTRMYYNADATRREGNTLHILRVAIDDHSDEGGDSEGSAAAVQAVQHLLAAAQEQAADWNTEAVEIWNPHPVTLAAAQRIDASIRIIERQKESIASLNWYGSGDSDRLMWLSIEKFAWC